MSNADALRREIAASQNSLRTAQERLQQIEANCSHKHDASAWGPVQREMRPFKREVVDVYAPMQGSGVDVYHPTRFVDETRPVWTRTCKHCGKVEETTETKARVTQEPAF
jgi:hypothetical protein